MMKQYETLMTRQAVALTRQAESPTMRQAETPMMRQIETWMMRQPENKLPVTMQVKKHMTQAETTMLALTPMMATAATAVTWTKQPKSLNMQGTTWMAQPQPTTLTMQATKIFCF